MYNTIVSKAVTYDNKKTMKLIIKECLLSYH